jgi:hypothetical protein
MRPITHRRWRWVTGYDCDATPWLTSAGTKMAPCCEQEYRSSGLPNRRKFKLDVRTLCPHKSILVRIHGVSNFWWCKLPRVAQRYEMTGCYGLLLVCTGVQVPLLNFTWSHAWAVLRPCILYNMTLDASCLLRCQWFKEFPFLSWNKSRSNLHEGHAAGGGVGWGTAQQAGIFRLYI